MNQQDLPAVSFVMLSMWFDIAPDAMIAVDRKGAIVLANAQAERMFGYGQGALQGLALEALVPESLRQAAASDTGRTATITWPDPAFARWESATN